MVPAGVAPVVRPLLGVAKLGGCARPGEATIAGPSQAAITPPTSTAMVGVKYAFEVLAYSLGKGKGSVA